MRAPIRWIEDALRACLREAWGIDAMLRPLLVGGGGHHWAAVTSGGRRFVTVNEVDAAGFADLSAALRTAHALAEAGVPAAGPIPARCGDVVVPLLWKAPPGLRPDVPGSPGCGVPECGARECGAPGCGVPGCGAPGCGAPGHGAPGHGAPAVTRTGADGAAGDGWGYAVSVCPFVDGLAGRFGETPPDAERVAVVELLARVHAATGQVPAPPGRALGLALRADLDAIVAEGAERARGGEQWGSGRGWCGGPYAGRAWGALMRGWPGLRRGVARFDELRERVADEGAPGVVTHGEPHPGNLVRTARGVVLVDWETVGTAPPERDLWMSVWPPGAAVGTAESFAAVRRYERLTGRTVSRAALQLYRLRWCLDDITLFAAELRAPHTRTADTANAYRSLLTSIAAVERIAG